MAKKNFLEKLQESDEDTKKIWVVAGTAVVMFVIVTAWLTWFNTLNTRPGSSNMAQVAAQAPDHGFSFWETVKSGFGMLSKAFQAPRDYIIKPN